MWTRVQLKDKAKQALKNNYWKIILVSLLVGLIGGGTATGVTNVLESDSGSSWESELDNEIKGELDIYEDEFDNGFSSGDIGGISTIGVAGFLIIFGIVFLFVLVFVFVLLFVVVLVTLEFVLSCFIPILSVKNENGVIFSSPSCIDISEKSILSL